MVDVDPVDLGHARRADADRQRAAADEREEPLPLSARQHLRVADAGIAARVRLPGHGGGDDGSAQGGDTDRIGADNDRASGLPVLALDARRWPHHALRSPLAGHATSLGRRRRRPRSVGAALAEGGGLADAVAKEVELGASGDAVADDLDLVDPRRVDHEGSLDADAAARCGGR